MTVICQFVHISGIDGSSHQILSSITLSILERGKRGGLTGLATPLIPSGWPIEHYSTDVLGLNPSVLYQPWKMMPNNPGFLTYWPTQPTEPYGSTQCRDNLFADWTVLMAQESTRTTSMLKCSYAIELPETNRCVSTVSDDSLANQITNNMIWPTSEKTKWKVIMDICLTRSWEA